MRARQLSCIALKLLVTGACIAGVVSVSAQGQKEVYPDAGFLDYLASLEEVDGEWLGPEQMQYLQDNVHGSPAPELLVTPEPDQPSSEQEEKQ